MSETAKHETLETDPASGVVGKLEKLDLSALSFTQLRRLRSALKHAFSAVDKESERRSAEESSGDTVRIPSPTR